MRRPPIEKRRFFIASASIAATFVYFLIFAQFSFLFMAESLFSQEHLTAMMAVMGACGLAGSFATSHLLKTLPVSTLLRLGFLTTTLVAFASLLAKSWPEFAILAGCIGFSLGMLTVTLAHSLVDMVGQKALGPAAAWGTGAAYAICNIPQVFHSDPRTQSLIAALFTAVAFMLQWFPQNQPISNPPATEIVTRGRAPFWAFLAILICFSLLIWLDASLFYIIQQTENLKDQTWIGSGRTLSNGLFHFSAALATGYLLRTLPFRFWIVLAFSFLASGALLLATHIGTWVAAPLYVVGVSIYSTCLVAYPGLLPEGTAFLPRRLRTAWVFGIAGWVGSALGIGMAKDLHRIPLLFLILCAASLAWVYRPSLGRRFAPLLTILVFSGLATFLKTPSIPHSTRTLPDPELGRRVYVSEGCIHCHSQYIRPGTADELLWGPAVPLQEITAQTPPLIGNRRTGPDLLNVGNRRGTEWQRIHLKNPRALAPNSTMPSYQHLFNDRRGEDLVAYLQSLGNKRFAPRIQQTQLWQPDPQTPPLDFTASCALYIQDCAPCHGISSRGDGPLAEQLPVRPRNLLSDPWVFLPAHPNEAIGLAQTVKFGIPGTNMPGHEHYSDAEVLGIVSYLRTLRNPHFTKYSPRKMIP